MELEKNTRTALFPLTKLQPLPPSGWTGHRANAGGKKSMYLVFIATSKIGLWSKWVNVCEIMPKLCSWGEEKNQNVCMGEASRIELLAHEENGKRGIVILGSSSIVGPLFHHSACFQYPFPCDPHIVSWCDRFHTECCEFLPEHPTISMIITQHEFYFSRGQLSCVWKTVRTKK